ncbi:MAG: CTP pyrophosphohydrolase [candidate division WS6 bacterium OLB20]|uniref:CTP pyrophosphohydrolase n=1 Tax=candidate division WS6 bacterium OLB20 TaxID=1617426 RepID=A0A136LZ06_9BACT|nr:MAG: CTP pyrophosphohydrolase [candidate division WS6 bacterium OLB20]
MPQLFYTGVKGIVHKDGRLLLLSCPDQLGRSYWDIPGGRIEPDEDISATLLRELAEELPGLTSVQQGPLVHAARMARMLNDGNGLMLLFYLVSGDISNKPELSEEHTGYRWVTREQAETVGDDQTYIDEGYRTALLNAFTFIDSQSYATQRTI